MLILVTITIKFGTGQIEKAKLEDLKSIMLIIKGKAKIIIDKEAFGETYNNEGMIKITDEAASKYNIPDRLKDSLKDLEQTDLYIWEQVAMDNNNIDVTITNTDFYIIDYSTKEIYYSLGYTYEQKTYYSLTDIQNI